jgi:hypothetical protein
MEYRGTPEKGGLLVEDIVGRTSEWRISLGEIPLWSWAVMALLLAMLFAALFASGALLAPLLGQASEVANYLHEFAHDGRHLLGVPCH